MSERTSAAVVIQVKDQRKNSDPRVLVVARVRRPGKVTLPASAYVDMSGLCTPESVADLESVPGWCFATRDVVLCGQGAAMVACTDCCMDELGEHLELFNARTNAGIPKGKFYRDLGRAQSQPDEDYRRLMAWKRRHELRG